MIIELFYSSKDFFADGNDNIRNIYYQKQSANEINIRVTEIISLLTCSLNIHLNLDQNIIINTSQVFLSLETILIESIQNKIIKQIENALFEIPSNFTSNITNHSSIKLRVCSSFDQNSHPIVLIFLFLVNNGTTCIIWKFPI